MQKRISYVQTTRYVIATVPRSGSTLFGSLLRSNPRVRGATEVLNFRRTIRQGIGRLVTAYLAPLPYIEQAMTRQMGADKPEFAYGFKFFPQHTLQYGPTLQTMAEQGWKIIYLRRDNLFRHTLSHYLAWRFKRFNSVQTWQADLEPFAIDVRAFERVLRQKDRERQGLAAIMRKVPHRSRV